MTATDHRETAAILIEQAEIAPDPTTAKRLAELAAWHEHQADTKALATVEPV